MQTLQSKNILTLAALTLIAGATQAQSSVTFYGLLDANFGAYAANSVNSDGSISSLSRPRVEGPGALNGNRWGIKGREELGSGFSAIFNLESGFNIDTGASGQGGVLFGRRAVVGFVGGFGSVELGRNSSPYDSVSSDHAMSGALNGTLWGQSGVGDPSNTNNGISTNNATAAATISKTAPTTGAGRVSRILCKRRLS